MHLIADRRWLLLLLFVGSSLFLGCRREPAPTPTPTPTATAVKILVAEDGAYRLTLTELQEGGLAVEALAADNVHLSSGGEPVPYYLEGDALHFYGRAPAGRYSAHRAYILETGKAGVALTTVPSAPAGAAQPAVTRTLHLEENWEYVSDARDRRPEGPWFWQTIQIQGEATVDFTLPPVAGGGGQLEIGLYGTTHNPAADPDHTLGVRLNDQDLGAITWDGQTTYTATVEIPAGTLQNGENSLLLANLPEDYLDIMKLDWMRVHYTALPTAGDADALAFTAQGQTVTLAELGEDPLLLALDEGTEVRRLTGWEVTPDGISLQAPATGEVLAVGAGGYRSPAAMTPLREGEWRDPEQQADLIIITTDTLAPALAPLVEARESQGLSVALVPVAEIYDIFGHGAATPESINAFLRYAAQEWATPHPRYLLLVGDATTDYRGYLAERPENPVAPPDNVIPPYLVPVSFSGETVSDARLADVDGDRAPDMAVGRWPVDSVEAAESLVARTLAYEAAPASSRALFAADGSSAEFAALSERLVAEGGLDPAQAQILAGPAAAEVADLWNDGTWLVTYTGHGSLKLWGKESIFSVDNVDALASDAPAPIVLQLTCLSGLFAHPEIVSLSEAMLAQEGGPVLTVAATSLTLSRHQEPFAARFLQALQDPAVERVGDALQVAKHSLDLDDPGLLEISDTFGLLGDPSALIVRPAG